MLHAYSQGIICLEGNLPGDELVKQDAERVDICRWHSSLSLETFRGHIGWRSKHLPSGRQCCGCLIKRVRSLVEKVYNAKIDEVHIPLFINKCIAGLNITMDHPTLVSIVNCARKLIQISCNLI